MKPTEQTFPIAIGTIGNLSIVSTQAEYDDIKRECDSDLFASLDMDDVIDEYQVNRSLPTSSLYWLDILTEMLHANKALKAVTK